ncbi:MAG: SDR family oxidoreductase [Pseudomonas sp.]|uniref:SDR family oxidoreductase n=1 Tax=Pseudomonas abieticivorans TaxID=2931382 RepID=UPI0020BE806A|nr:SDR family oxidoreductase [Pseudomonas sp. PIA16]MDE1166462.1 SDR family oxidoreductase [Pseudomonas sp.]
MSTFTVASQIGKRAVITGATGGLGYETALVLAGAGADVLLTGRNAAKGAEALKRIRAIHPKANVRYDHLDLSSLASVADFSARYASGHDALDLLINNAGVMAPPTRHATADGFELQMGSNYLGHYALTAQLLPHLRKGHEPRVVNLSSIAHRNGAAIHFDDLQWQRSYKAWPAYSQSKLAMLMFAFELQRRSDANGWGLMSNASHPGFARTALQSTGPQMGRGQSKSLFWQLSSILEKFASHSAAEGAQPTLLAATSPLAKPGGYYGPQGLMGLKGAPGEASVAGPAKDLAVAARLWQVSEQLTGVRWSEGA